MNELAAQSFRCGQPIPELLPWDERIAAKSCKHGNVKKKARNHSPDGCVLLLLP